jgi:hypothetical protein
MAYTKPIGVAFTDQDISGANVVLVDEQLGYTAEGQGTVTQLTSKSTAVTLNKPAGQITMNNAALAGNTAVSFTLNNSYISSNDILILAVAGNATTGAYTAYVTNIASGTTGITLRNLTAGSLSEAVILNFALIHCA